MSAKRRGRGSDLEEERGSAVLRRFLACAALAPVLALPALATPELRVRLADLEDRASGPESTMNLAPRPNGAAADPAGLAVTLVGPDGDIATAVDDDDDGLIVFRLEGRAGEYLVTAALGRATVTRTVRLLAGGGVTLTWYSPGDEVKITYWDEIVVSARRREEELQTVPMSITAFNQKALESRNLNDLSDVGDFAPNVDFSVSNGLGGATSEATVFIRGIGQLDTALFADPGVGIYVDGVYLARAGGSVLDLLDLERVEILRGPQGTLFGKNTTGGAISLVTRKPGSRPKNSLGMELTTGEYDRLDGRLTADLQLTDSVFGILAAASTNRDGFTESLASGLRFANDNRDSIRGALRWLVSDSSILDLSIDVTSERETASTESLLVVESTPLIHFYNRAVADAGLTPVGEAFITGDLRRSYSQAESRNNGDVAGATLTFSWTFDNVDILSISAYREIEYDVANDGDGTPRILAHRSFDQHQNQWSQEVHLSGLALDDRLRWLVGGLYFTESSDEDSLVLVFGDLFDALEAAPGPVYAPPGVASSLCFPGPPPPGLPCFGGPGNPLNFAFFTGDGDFERIDLKTDSWALFGDARISLTSRLQATLGLRYTAERKEFSFFRQPGSGLAPTDLVNQANWSNYSPRLSLSYEVADDALVYFSAARGFRSGGFNGRPQMREALDPFGPEIVRTYELGWKTDLGDMLRLNGAAFLSDYDDIQFSASVNVGAVPVFVILNAGEAEATGFELELSAQPVSGLEVVAAVGHVQTKYTRLNDVAPNSVTLDGVFPKSPEWTFTLSPRYAFVLKSGGTLSLSADYSYRSEFFNDIQNSPQILQSGYGLLSSRIAWSSAGQNWKIAVFGTNLSNEEYLEHAFSAPAFGVAVGTAGRPREWGVSVSRRFSFDPGQ